MKWLTRFSLKNAVAIVIVAALVTAGGLYSAMQLKQETMPDVSVPIVAVMTIYPGASPSDVLADVTKPMEDSVGSVAGVQHVNSTSAENVSLVVAEFSFSENMDDAKSRVTEAIAKVKLPTSTQAPQVIRWSFGSMPIVKLAIANSKVPMDELEGSVRDNVLPKLTGVDGVGQVQLASESAKSIYIRLDPKKLLKYGVTSEQVKQQLQAANLSFPVGKVEMGELSEPVRVTGTIRDLDALKNLQIPVQPNTAKLMGQAFGQIGSGMGQLGQAVGGMGQALGQMGTGMGQLGQAVGGLGQGLAGATQGLNGEVQLLQGITEAQSGVLEMKIALADAQSVVRDPDASAADKATANATIGQLNAQISGTEAVIAQLKSQLAAIQKQLGAVKAPSMSSGGSSASSSDSGLSGLKRSGGSTSSKKSSLDMKLTFVKLSQVADVKLATGDAAAISRLDGNAAVLLEITKAQDANTVDVADGVRAKLDSVKAKLPAGSEVKVTYDASESVRESINGMLREGLLGALCAFLIILLFLRNFRATVIAAVSIPLSMLITMVLIGRAGITLNVMTLGGLTVAIGRVVDDSIVVIENVFRHIQEGEERGIELIRRAVAEVASPVMSSTLTTVGVFVPLGLVSGMIGKVFQPFAITVGLALLSSLLVSITVVPLLAKWLLLRAKLQEHGHDEKGALGRVYERALGWSLRHKLAIAGLVLATIAGAGALVPLVGTGFMPEQKEHFVDVNLAYPDGTNSAAVDAGAKKVEAALAKDKVAEEYQTVVGSPQGSASMNMRGQNQATISVKLAQAADADKTIARWRRDLTPLAPKDALTVTAGASQLTGGDSKIEISVLGEDYGKVKQAAARVTAALRGVKGLGEPSNNVGESKPEVAVSVSQSKAVKQALSAGQVAMTMRSLLSEDSVGTMKLDGRKTDVKLGLKLSPVTKVADLRSIEMASPLGTSVPLSKIANVRQVAGPVTVYTKDGSQYAVVSAEILAKDAGAVNSAVQAKLDSLKLPAGVTTEVGGTTAMMGESFKQMGIAMLVAIGVVYLVMVLAFGEAIAPLAILFSLPLALIGGIFGLWVFGETLNMPAMIGALMLIGLVVTNAIVLMDRVQDNRREGMTTRVALMEAGGVRLRPILMTALATIAALIPLVAGMSEGSLISRSLAAIVMGGLTTSTLLTLVVVPVVYEALDGLRARVLGRGGAEPEPGPKVESQAA